jgi:peptidoglycan/LPS O-acetylase OafA/YrhL
VLAFHEGFSALPGGFLGVDLFFVISGYLITDLLAVPWDTGGRLDLRRFWVRRARRLLPCLAVLLVAVTAAVAVLEPDQLAALRPDLLAAMTYTSNWWQALHHQSYFSAFGPPPPLQHLWSLAIEEQFYLIWPLILTVILCACQRRSTRAAVVWLGAAASALAMAAGYMAGTGSSRLYYGTDTHATALLVGAALAFSWPLHRLATASAVAVRRLNLAGLAGAAVLGWEMTRVSGNSSAAYLGGIAVAAVAAGAVVVAAAGPGAPGRVLGWAPLRWVGLRSYGIYLWHWPVIALFAARTGAQSTTFGVRLAETALAITLAAASWRWIEEPILHNGLAATLRTQRATISRSISAARRSPARALPALIPVAAIMVVCTAGYGVLYSPPGQTLQQQIAAGTRVSAATRAQADPHQAHAAAGQARPGSRRAAGKAQAGEAGAQRAPASDKPALVAAGTAGHLSLRQLGRGITAIGDSVMLASAIQLRAALPGIFIDARVSRQMSQGVAVARQLASSGELRPIVVVGLGTNGAITMQQVRVMRAVAGPHRMLVLVNTYVPRSWQAEVNGVLAAASRRYHDIILADWLATIRNRTSLLWGDGVHPRPEGAVLYTRMVAAAALQAARRAAHSAPASARHAPAGPAASPRRGWAWHKLSL